MPSYSPEQLIALWRHEAALLRARAADVQATILEQCAAELEAAYREMVNARVGLDEAVAVTGFTRGHLHRLLKNGKLVNVGSDEKPEFILSQLPKKPGYSVENITLAQGKELPADYEWQAARAVLFGE